MFAVGGSFRAACPCPRGRGAAGLIHSRSASFLPRAPRRLRARRSCLKNPGARPKVTATASIESALLRGELHVECVGGVAASGADHHRRVSVGGKAPVPVPQVAFFFGAGDGRAPRRQNREGGVVLEPSDPRSQHLPFLRTQQIAASFAAEHRAFQRCAARPALELHTEGLPRCVVITVGKLRNSGGRDQRRSGNSAHRRGCRVGRRSDAGRLRRGRSARCLDVVDGVLTTTAGAQ